MKKHGASGNFEEFFRAEIDFHVGIAEAIGSNFQATFTCNLDLMTFLGGTSRAINSLSNNSQKAELIIKYSNAIIEEHQDIFSAFISLDREKVDLCLRSNIKNAYDYWRNKAEELLKPGMKDLDKVRILVAS